MEPIYLPYYQPDIASSEEAKKYLLKHMDKVGAFILRKSKRSLPTKLAFSLSVVYSENMIHHVNIQKKGSKFFLVRDQEFDSIEALVSNYSKEDIPNGNFKSLRLLHGVGGKENDVGFVDLGQPPPRPPRPSRSDSENGPKVPPRRTNHQLSTEEKEIVNVSKHNFSPKEDQNPPPRPPKPGQITDIKTASANFVDPDWLDKPMPTPTSRGMCNGLSDFILNTTGDENLYDCGMYSRVAENHVDRTHELIQMLNDIELDELQHMKCDCGIYHNQSLLPGGWTVHRSKDPATAGQLFFTSKDGVTTSWTLPDKIWYQLRPEHVSTLKNLADDYGVVVPAPVDYLIDKR